jgi:predicted nuclease of predicted toxin-antitoxin system
VRLLLDEMVSFRIARELREKGHDVQAIKRDRPELASRDDQEIVQRMAAEQRAIVTNDVIDFEIIHTRVLAAGDRHAGLIFTFDEIMPRTKPAIPLWVERLARLLEAHPGEEPLRNQVLELL